MGARTSGGGTGSVGCARAKEMRMNLNKGDLVRLTRTSEEWGLELEPITGIVLGWEYLFTRGRGGCIDLQILEDSGRISYQIISDRDRVEVLSEPG
jgi:hypothetical protein